MEKEAQALIPASVLVAGIHDRCSAYVTSFYLHPFSLTSGHKFWKATHPNQVPLKVGGAAGVETQE